MSREPGAAVIRALIVVTIWSHNRITGLPLVTRLLGLGPVGSDARYACLYIRICENVKFRIPSHSVWHPALPFLGPFHPRRPHFRICGNVQIWIFGRPKIHIDKKVDFRLCV